MWKPKHNAIEDPVLMMNAKFFVCLFFILLCFFFQVHNWRADIIVELMQKQIMLSINAC